MMHNTDATHDASAPRAARRDEATRIETVLTEADAGTKRRRRLLWSLLILVLAVVGLVLTRASMLQETPISYTTALAERGELIVTVTATGNLQPVNRVDVGTEISGTIDVVEADFNDQVSVGQVLARLNTEQLEARLRQSRAALAVAEASVLEARATVTETASRLKRARELTNQRLASQEELDISSAAAARAEAALAMAEANVEQARAQLTSDQRDMEKAIIRAPIDGLVLERKVEKGQTVAATLQTPLLFTLAEDLRQMVLHVDVDEADIGRISVGQGARFTVDAYPERTFPAEIQQIRFAPKTIDGVVSYETLLVVANDDLALMPGMTATAEVIVTRAEEALLVPNAALRFSPRPLDTADPGTRRTGLLGMLMPRPLVSNSTPAVATPATTARVWTLRDGVPEPIAVQVIATDGTLTQIAEGAVSPGMELLVDMRVPGA